MEEFNLDSFIAGINSDTAKKEKSTEQYLTKVLMNTRNNQGTVTFIPIMSKETKNFYLKVPRVLEYYASTSLVNSGEAWYKVMPLEMYGALTAEEAKLYSEVKTLLDKVSELPDVTYNEFRVRNYAMFHGICQGLVNTEKQKVTDYDGKPCLFLYPSASVIDAFGTAVSNKIDAMKGKKEWILYVLSPKNTGRKGVIQVSFIKSSGPGYDATVSFEFNSDLNTVVDPDMVIADDVIAKFDKITPTFLGWMYDRDNDKLFNATAFNELKDNLMLRLNNQDKPIEPADSFKEYEVKNLEIQKGSDAPF